MWLQAVEIQLCITNQLSSIASEFIRNPEQGDRQADRQPDRQRDRKTATSGRLQWHHNDPALSKLMTVLCTCTRKRGKEQSCLLLASSGQGSDCPMVHN